MVYIQVHLMPPASVSDRALVIGLSTAAGVLGLILLILLILFL